MQKKVKKIFGILSSLIVLILASCTPLVEPNYPVSLNHPIVTLENNVISWNSIEKAAYYEIYANDELLIKVSDTSYTLQLANGVEFKIYVIALDDTLTIKSEKSNVVTYFKNVQSANINFLSINDTHGVFEDEQKGMAKLDSLIDELTNSYGKYIKIANGDIFQGTYTSNILHGEPLINALNAMEFDAFVIGNHEFDWGLEEIHRFKDGDLSNGEANFPFLGANIYDKKTGERVEWLEPYTIVNLDDLDVGIIGVIGEDLESSILSSNVQEYEFMPVLPIIEELATTLRTEKGCEIVVVAIHDYDSSISEEIASLSKNALIDALFCGHTHTYIDEVVSRSDVADLPVVQTNGYNSFVWSIRFNYQINEKLTWSKSSYKLYDYLPTSRMLNIIETYREVIDEGNRVLGTTNETMTRDDLGMLATTMMVEKYQVDVSIMNTGGVRSTISAGEIKVSDVFEVFPFDNTIYVTTISYEDLNDFYNKNKRYMYFNEGFEELLAKKQKTYTLAIIDYVFLSTRYDQFSNCTNTEEKKVLRDDVIDYINQMK